MIAMDWSDKSGDDLGKALAILGAVPVIAPEFGLPGVMVGTVLALFNGAVSGWLSRRSVKRLQEYLQHLEDILGPERREFLERLARLEPAEDLAFHATRSAAGASSMRHSHAIAAMLARGVMGSQEDAPRYELFMSALDGLTSKEVEGLLLLSDHERLLTPGQGAGPSAEGVLSDGRSDLTPEAEAIVARLVARGMVKVDPPGFGGFGLTQLGREVAGAFKSDASLPESEP